MKNKMDEQGKIEKLLKKDLGTCCFVRQHQEEKFLFVTDFPLRAPEKVEKAREELEKMGLMIFLSGRENNLWALDFSPAKWQEILKEAEGEEKVQSGEKTLFLCHLFEKNRTEDLFSARLLYRWAGQKKSAPSRKNFEKEKERLYRRLCQRYALLQRQHAPLPGRGCGGLLKRSLL